MKRLLWFSLILLIALAVGIRYYHPNTPLQDATESAIHSLSTLSKELVAAVKPTPPSATPDPNAQSSPNSLNSEQIEADSQKVDNDSNDAHSSNQEAARTETALATQLQAALNANASKPLKADQAHHFVNEDQLIILPNMDTVNRASLEEWIPANEAQQNAPMKTTSNHSLTHDGNGTDATSFAVSESALKPFKPNDVAQATTQDQAPDSSTIPNLIVNGSNSDTQVARTIRLKELLNEPDSEEKRVFYLHSVNQQDRQGLWGIVQTGLTKRFAEGILLENKGSPISALIPPMADERLDDKTSSFLGKRLHQKVANIYVFNYQQGVIGKNPDIIHPGQQLVIVAFTESELLDIYREFSNVQ